MIFKTFLYQVVMSFFGIMMYTATNSNTLLLVVGQVFVILFFWYIMSSQMYQAGYKTKEYDHAHGTSSSPFLGFFLSFIAFLPTVLMSAWVLIFPPFDSIGQAQGIGYIPFLLNKTFLQGMHISLAQWIYPTSAGGLATSVAIENAAALNSQGIFYLLGSIPGFLASGIGYLVGCLRFQNGKQKKR